MNRPSVELEPGFRPRVWLLGVAALIRHNPLARLKLRVDVSRRVQDPHHLDSVRQRSVERQVATGGELTKTFGEFGTRATRERVSCEQIALFPDDVDDRVRCPRIVECYVEPRSRRDRAAQAL